MAAVEERIQNLGPRSRSWLAEVGIATLSDLRECGSIEAFLRIRTKQPRVSLNLLWSLEAAIQGLDWRGLPNTDKDRLRAELQFV